jgi:hypothetical protein
LEIVATVEDLEAWSDFDAALSALGEGPSIARIPRKGRLNLQRSMIEVRLSRLTIF